jgi:hypothetical protein
LVAHGGIFAATIKALCPEIDMNHILGSENHNCSISEIMLDERDGELVGQLISWAQCVHITGEAAEFVLPVPEEHAAGNRGKA